MIDATLTGPSGEELFLTQPATVQFPLDPARNLNPGDQVPLWHMDDASSMWI